MKNVLFLLLTAFSIGAAAQSGERTDVSVRKIANDGTNLWLATYDGLLKYNKQTGEQTLYNTDNSGLITNWLNSVACIDGYVWIGTYGSGAAKFNGYMFVPYDRMGDKESLFYEHQIIIGIAADADGKIWLGGQCGLYRFDGKNWEWNYIPDSDWRAYVVVSSMAFDKDSTLWFGCAGTLLNSLGRITKDGKMEIMQSVGNASIYNIAIDKAGNVWFSSIDRGIGRFDGTTVERFYSQNSPLPTDLTHGLAIDEEDNVWFGCGRDLYKYDGELFTVYELPTEKVVSDVLVDGDVIWVGTYGGGLFRLANGEISNIRLIDTPAAIQSVTATAKQATTSTYDLQGRRLTQKPEKGVYIENGRKRVVK
jgi:ligand-binding sensor domain-containing protein